MHPARPRTAAAPKTMVLAAAHPLHAGALIQPGDLAAVAVAGKAPPQDVIDTPAHRSDFTGAMVRQPLAAQQPITSGAVIRPGDHGFLAAVLSPGMRAVTVGVDAITGTAGLIWPGDRVDLLLTQQLNMPHLPPAQHVSAETVLSDVRVIAIDQRLVQGASADHKSPGLARTVTLEVTPAQAERVSVAERLGSLSLVVRSAELSKDPATASAPPPAPVYGGQVSPALAALTPPAAAGGRMIIFQGPGRRMEYTPQ
jgi:pilus assembly protein CpaB